jgi:TolB-like protein/cytochrome c-type biogenesis protein CcmH/NrfG
LLARQPDFAQTGREIIQRWFQPDLTEHYIEGLRKAGLEIGARRTDSTRTRTLRADEGFWVAVLPFKCASANPDLMALAEGLSEEIVTGLSRFSYLRVIARASTARYANTAIDVRAVGTDIGARYVMEGSVRQAGSQLRVTAQLVDSSTGAHLWAETFDRAFRPDDIFALQDELVPRIVSTVADQHGVLVHSMSAALGKKSDAQLSAHEAALRVFGFHERMTADEHAKVRALLERAVEQTPDDSDCWAMLATVYTDEHMFGFNALPDPLGRAQAAARRAMELSPSSALANQALAQSLFFRKELQAFRPVAERTIALNPMDGAALAFIGLLLALSGEWERGCDVADTARKLNPHFPGWYWLAPLFHAHHKGDYRAAVGFATRINIPGYFWVPLTVAAASGHLGDRAAAQKAVRELLAIRPDFGSMARAEFEKWFQPDLVESYLDGLGKAGLEIVYTSASGRAAPATQSIAVLPFANLSAAKDQEYFSDGLAEEIINSLAQVSGLKVIARTSAFAFRGKEQDIREIAAALGVTTVLQGSVRRAGSRIRVATQLINASDGAHLWSERFDRELTEVFAVQDEIAAAIAGALKVKLTGQPAAARSHDPNLAAYDAFLKGKHYYYQFSPAHFTSAEQDFVHAIQLDPQWAEPHAALGDLYFAMGFYGWRPLEDMIPRARDEAHKALELAPSHPLAHAVLGIIAAHHDYNWPEAEDQFRRVGASEFVHPNVHLLSLFYLLSLGRFDAALAEAAKAIAEDPLNSFWRARRAWVLMNAKRYDEAIAEARHGLEFDETNYQARMMMALSYTFQGNLALGLEAAEAVYQTAPFDAFGTGLLGGILMRLGEKERAEQVIASMTGAVTIGMTIYHLVAGEIDAAIDSYQKDIELHRPNAPMVAFAGWLEPLRASPRWAHVVGLMNLPTVSR